MQASEVDEQDFEEEIRGRPGSLERDVDGFRLITAGGSQCAT